jgi:hypothetical protein
MDDIEINKNRINLKNIFDEKNKEIDTTLFDKTLRQIENILEKLDEKPSPKQLLQSEENTKEEILINNEEHTIDNTQQRMEDLHDFNLKPEIKNKNTFGFYTYLTLIVGIIFAIYEILNVTKNIIVSKYPFSEPYIEYFYEIIEILAYVVMNTITFVKNLF